MSSSAAWLKARLTERGSSFEVRFLQMAKTGVQLHKLYIYMRVLWVACLELDIPAP